MKTLRLSPLTTILLLTIAQLLTACRPSFPGELLLTEQDLPQLNFHTSDASEPPGFLRGYTLFNLRGDLLAIRHEVRIYPNEQATLDAYLQWETETFSQNNWQPSGDFTFTPSDPNDQSRFACLDQLGHTPCRYMQQHKNTIWVIWTNLYEGEWELAQVEAVLALLDARMNAYTK